MTSFISGKFSSLVHERCPQNPKNGQQSITEYHDSLFFVLQQKRVLFAGGHKISPLPKETTFAIDTLSGLRYCTIDCTPLEDTPHISQNKTCTTQGRISKVISTTISTILTGVVV